MEFQGCVYDCKSNIRIEIEEMLSLNIGPGRVKHFLIYCRVLDYAFKAINHKIFYESSVLPC